MCKDLITHIISRFKIEDGEISIEPITHGYINNTYLVFLNSRPKYILQRINQNVFKNVEDIQHNIECALKALKGSGYSEIEFIRSFQDQSLVIQDGHYWRLMTYVHKSEVHNTTQDPKIAFEAGRIIGVFHKLVQNENLDEYFEVIPNFHDLRYRNEQFIEALNGTSDPLKNKAKEQIEYAKKVIPEFDPFYHSDLHLRLCHNDTKLNNILFNSDKNALCLIDLDTIMKGHFHYDFGDAVKTIINRANENEIDVSKVTFDIYLFKNFVEGLKASQLRLSQHEIELLPLSVALMSFLHGIRALTDYLNGNIYYKVTYPDQNLNRAKILFQFTRLALANLLNMKNVIDGLK